jgi:hypothetical protein
MGKGARSVELHTYILSWVWNYCSGRFVNKGRVRDWAWAHSSKRKAVAWEVKKKGFLARDSGKRIREHARTSLRFGRRLP